MRASALDRIRGEKAAPARRAPDLRTNVLLEFIWRLLACYKLKVKKYRENFELVKSRLSEVEEKDKIRNWQPPISGELIMEIFALPPSKTVGDLKNAIREAILDGEISNNYDDAYDLLMKKAEEMDLKPVSPIG